MRKIWLERLFFLLVGGAFGVSGLWLFQEYPYFNRMSLYNPVAGDSLVFRNDSMGEGHFGAKRSRGRTHRGVDILAPQGSDVYAVLSGYVLESEFHKSLGNYIRLHHGDGLTTLYAHLDALFVDPGERVVQGHKIGAIGKTGNANSVSILPHLHLEVRKHGEFVDPETIGLIVTHGNTLN